MKVVVLPLVAAVLAAGLDYATRLLNVTHLVGSIVGALFFAGAGFVNGSMGAPPARGYGMAAVGGVVYGALTVVWVLVHLGAARGSGPAAVAALFNLVLGGMACALGFSSGQRARARRGPGE
jgi:hypothetical protein